MDGFFVFAGDDDDDPYKKLLGADHPREKTIQIIVSLGLGVTAFLAFCVFRPRWSSLYAARKKLKNEAAGLPELPDSLFGWILPLWRITDQQVLASAGLDAFAFLAFFKMAMKFLVITFFFSLIVIKPVHDANPDKGVPHHKKKHNETDLLSVRRSIEVYGNHTSRDSDFYENDYLWMYLAFAYLFTALAIYLIISETRRIIEIRQEYLGTQTSVTDRTIRLSGIPAELREEDKIKEFIEALDIGRVDSVTLCRNWKELDDAIQERTDILRRLEEAYTTHLGHSRFSSIQRRQRRSQPVSQDASRAALGEENDNEGSAQMGINGQAHISNYDQPRPKTGVRYGFLHLRSRQVDAIDYYEERLRQMDDRVKELRAKTFAPTPLAFVTMDSVAACQMAIQAVLDPSPLQLIANQSPAPVDVIWSNTYMTRRGRMIRQWSVTVLIVLSTLFWSVVFVPVAGLLSTEAIAKVFPGLAAVLEDHPNLESLFNTQLPTAIASLLMVLVPYLYYWVSWYQGMISQGDVELSAISKNFFFTFFNFFIVFTVLGTASKFYQFFDRFGDNLRDFRHLAKTLASSLQRLLEFYTNFIILQGLGLFPFRMLEVGSISIYGIFRMGAKTPRDYAELAQPPVFRYGFYLPTALLIFVICMVYSVLRSSWQVLLAGLIYFAFGHFVYKYQLLYAMDHQQQATGRAWVMICDRVFIGLLIFQLATAGQLVFQDALSRSTLMIPLVFGTIWVAIAYGRAYKPLMQFIALRSVRRGEQYTDAEPAANIDSPGSADLAPERNVWASGTEEPQLKYYRHTRTGLGRPEDDSIDLDQRFVNPSLVAPLDTVWIADKSFRRQANGTTVEADDAV